ncbi:MAG TPA: NUDIX hydrolase [Gemmatimonadales bacterium]|jgi:8-oxo-dGTP pyrophosphatase MutT (NUDIX family)
MTKQIPVEEHSAGGVIFRRAPHGGNVLLIKDAYRNWGFPKGHLEEGEESSAAALREIAEETGLTDLVNHGHIQDIDWFFRFRGKLIHKTCAFFLVEAPTGEPLPQQDEGITACRWLPVDEAMRTLSYANARDVLRAAAGLMSRLAA